jgi:4Fe-4S ferredoxin
MNKIKFRGDNMTLITRKGESNRSLTHINDKCVGCGICASLCPTESIKNGPVLPIARGLVEMDYININKNNCCLCGLCSSACPFDALEFKINGKDIKEMEEYPNWVKDAKIDTDMCIYCKSCETACPQDAIKVARTLPKRENLVIGEIDIDQETCINCKICEELCPGHAIKVIQTGRETFETVVDEKKCVYCLVCKRACPTDAIKAVCSSCAYQDYKLDPDLFKTHGTIILNNDSCINCGWCQEICPVEASVVKKPFEGDISYKEDMICKGNSCHACKDVCPCNAVSIIEDHSFIDPRFCILCGACSNVCPQKGITINRTKMNLENIQSKSWARILSSLVK